MGAPIEPVEITAGPVHLRPWRAADAPVVHRICQDPDIVRWTTVPSPYTTDHARHFVAEQAPAGWAEGSAAIWAVCEATSGAVQASMGLHLDRCGDAGVAELGFWCAPEARGRGVVTTAARAACRWGFEALDLRRIEWYAQLGNEASWRVAHQAGFRFEGTARARLNGPRGVADGWTAGLLPGQVPAGRVPLPFGPDPELTDGPLCVRRWREPDVPAYQAAYPGARPADGTPGAPAGADGAGPAWQAVCVAAVQGWLTGRCATLAVSVGGVAVGEVQLRPRQGQWAELGWWWADGADPAAAADALRLVAGWAASLGWRRLEVRLPTAEQAGVELARQAGFAAEGTVRTPDGDAVLLGWLR